MASKNGNGSANGTPRRLNVAQRKALEKVIRDRYSNLMAERDGAESKTWQDLQAEAMQTVKKELGVDKIEAEIRELEAKRRALGFSHYALPDHGSKAKIRLDEILSTHKRNGNRLMREMEDKIARIWTVETVEEAENLLEIGTPC